MRECYTNIEVDQGAYAYHSDSPAHRQGSKSPDGNAKGSAFDTEEAPVEGQNGTFDDANGVEPANLGDIHAL